MKRRVEFEIDVPDDADDSEVLRWLQFALGELGDCPMSNPYWDQDVQGDDVRLY
jgi:hypothetical protein